MNNSDLIFFTADTHFGHRMMIDPRVGRPFADVDQMDEQLIENWNAVVPKNGTVYHLGDVSFRTRATTQSILARLNGIIRLVKGNHDDMNHQTAKRFEWIRDYYELDVHVQAPFPKRQRLVLSHYPLRVWNHGHHGAWHCHGHSHGNLEPIGRMLDVGIDSKLGRREFAFAANDPSRLRPLTFKEVADYMATRTFVVEDHHSERNAD